MNRPGQRVAFTGFRPFPGVPENPTQTLIETMHASGAFPDCAFHLIETSYAAVPAALDSILADDPRAVVMTGYSSQATGVTLEAIATDHRIAGRPDATGYCPPEAAATARLGCPHIDFAALLARLRAAGLPAEISQDAGSYVCNHALFTALGRIDARGCGTPAIFVHIPAIAGTPLAETSAAALPLADLVRALAIVGETLAPFPQGASA